MFIKKNTRTIYQAGYYSGNDWIVCGYGKSPISARLDLHKRLAEAGSILIGNRYLEQSSTEVSGTSAWDSCEDCGNEFESYGSFCKYCKN